MFRVLIICFAALAGAACSSKSDGLDGTKWLAEEIDGSGALASVRSTLEFTEPDHVEGQGGCNRYGGGVKIETSVLRFGDFASTKMACAEAAAMNQENRFFATFAAIRSYRLEGTKLLLLDAQGKARMRLAPLDN